MRTRTSFANLAPDDVITREDISVLADVRPTTVTLWARDEGFPLPAMTRGRITFYRFDAVLDWLCATGRLDCPDDGLLDVSAVAERMGVKLPTLRAWRWLGLFPEPDVRRGRTPYWFDATVRSVTDIPRGQRRGRTQQ